MPADHYAVKSEWSKDFLVREGLARAEQVSVLVWEESYCLVPGKDEYVDAYLESEAKMREMLNISWDEFIILIPHHVAFLWEARKILEALASLARPFTVVVRVDAKTTRRQYPEREIVLRSYEKEMRRLPRVLIDERIGVGLLLQLADLVVSPVRRHDYRARCALPQADDHLPGDGTVRVPRGIFLLGTAPGKNSRLDRVVDRQGWLPRPRFARILTDLATRRARAAA